MLALLLSAIPPITFALMPAQADNKIIDYTLAEGKKLYMLATMKLNIPFDSNPTNLEAFLDSIQEQADSSNWEQIMMTPDNQGILQSVIDKYGLLTMEHVCNHAKSYLWNVCRDAQNSYQLFLCIKYSSTK